MVQNLIQWLGSQAQSTAPLKTLAGHCLTKLKQANSEPPSFVLPVLWGGCGCTQCTKFKHFLIDPNPAVEFSMKVIVPL